MSSDSLFAVFTTRLEQAGMEYMVTGSVAGMVYGEPRLTHDVDIVLRMEDSDIEILGRLFPDEEFYCPPAEVIRVEARRAHRGHFNIIEHKTGFRADIYIAGKDPLHRWALSNRTKIEYEGHEMQLAPVEYVIAKKLEFYREGASAKHLDDVRGILRYRRADLDTARLTEIVGELGLLTEWESVSEDK